MIEPKTLLDVPLLEWLSLYGYWILLPLFIIEGTIIGFAAGTLAAIGVFNPWLVIALYVLGKVISDSFLFIVARHGSGLLERFSFTRKILERAEQSKQEEAGWVHKFDDHIFSLLVFAKVAPLPSLAEVLLVTAGTLKVNAKRVYAAIFIGQPIWSLMIVGLGYYFGGTIQNPEQLLNWAGLVTLGLVVASIMYYTYLHDRLQRAILPDVFVTNRSD